MKLLQWKVGKNTLTASIKLMYALDTQTILESSGQLSVILISVSWNLLPKRKL